MKKSIELLFPCLFTFLLVVEVVNYLANPSDPAYQFPVPFYALMVCVWSWFLWDLAKQYTRFVLASRRLLEIANEIVETFFSITRDEIKKTKEDKK